MSDTGRLTEPEQLPDWSKEWPAPAQVRFPLRATPKPHQRLVAGSANQGFVIRSVQVPQWPALVTASGVRKVLVVTGKVELSGLVHARTLGAPRVNPQTKPAGLDHLRALGTIVIAVTTPPDPGPGPGPGPSPSGATLSGGPRSIRGVRRRDIKHR